MECSNDRKIPYEAVYAAHLPVLGAEGQERLHQARVHIVGAGRVGSVVALCLVGAGVGTVSINDRQAIEPDNANTFVFSLADVGQKKVQALRRRLAARDHLAFHPIPLPVESAEIDPYIEAADLIICCANTVAGRIAAEQKAIRYGSPMMQVAVLDGRDCLGGLIAARLPENPWSACVGCYLDPNRNWSPVGGLLSTVTSTLGAISANMAVAILSGVRAQMFREKNLFYVDIERYAIEALAVERRKGCAVCG